MYKLYSRVNDKDTIFEVWGGSTKHPDCRFFFSDFEKSNWCDEIHQIFPWLLECASKMNFPFHSYQIAKFAMEYGGIYGDFNMQRAGG